MAGGRSADRWVAVEPASGQLLGSLHSVIWLQTYLLTVIREIRGHWQEDLAVSQGEELMRLIYTGEWCGNIVFKTLQTVAAFSLCHRHAKVDRKSNSLKHIAI